MTDDLDLALRDRLASLAAAAPVRPEPPLGSVPVVRVRRRPMAFGSLAPILGVVLLGTVVAGLAHVGPFATGSPAPGGSVSATTRSGDFTLSIDSSKARYAQGEPISIAAELSYSGPAASVVLSHAGSGPLAFGIVEPVNGLTLEPFWRLGCTSREFQRGLLEHENFQKSGGWDGADPSAGAYESFFADQALRLPVGTWHLYAIAQFSVGECSAEPSKIRAEITIEVVAGATAEPSARDATALPSRYPSESPTPGREGDARATTNNGTFRIQILTPRAVVHEGDPITIFTTYRYVAGEDRGRILHVGPAVVFNIEQLNTGIRMTLVDQPLGLPCSSDPLPNDDVSVAFGEVREITAEALTDDWLDLHFDGNRLRLPIGTWRISAVLVASTTDCLGADSPGLLHASIDIEVQPQDVGGLPILTAAAPQTLDRSCGITTANGRVVQDPVSGLGLHRGNGTVTPVRWLFDMRAELRASGPVLYDPNGFEFAREGEDIGISGAFGADGIFEMCLPFATFDDPVLTAPPG